MRYLIFLLFALNFSFAQMANGNSSEFHKYGVAVNYINSDLNNDDRAEIMKGDIIKISSNEYWIKNTELTSADGNVISFNSVLLKNNEPIIEQVNAKYGYILVFRDKSSVIDIYVADETGNKDSDVLYLELN